MQPVKSKNKTSTVSVIRKEELINVFKQVNPPEGLSENVLALIEPLVYLNPKFPQIYQVKNLGMILGEAAARTQLMEGASVTQAADGAQVVSFKQLESDEEN